MASYHIYNGEKLDFRFFENRYWDDDQENLANDYFIFNVDKDDLFNLGYVYWAHIAIWGSGMANKEIQSKYNIHLFEKTIYKELSDLKIEDNPPNFGYDNPALNVIVMTLDFSEFTVLKINNEGILSIDDNKNEFYFDINECDICSMDDLEYDAKKLIKGKSFTINPGDPVFMDDYAFEIVKSQFLNQIRTLNSIYDKVKFPYQIKII